MTTPNKTPAYILRCQKRYYDRIKDTEEYKTKRRQWNKIYYEKIKEMKETLNRLHVGEVGAGSNSMKTVSSPCSKRCDAVEFHLDA